MAIRRLNQNSIERQFANIKYLINISLETIIQKNKVYKLSGKCNKRYRPTFNHIESLRTLRNNAEHCSLFKQIEQ